MHYLLADVKLLQRDMTEPDYILDFYRLKKSVILHVFFRFYGQNSPALFQQPKGVYSRIIFQQCRLTEKVLHVSRTDTEGLSQSPIS